MSGSTLKLISFELSVTDTAAPLSATDLWVAQLTILNLSTSASVCYIGDSTVVSTASFPIAIGGVLGVDLNNASMNRPGRINLKNVYVRCAAAGTSTLRALYLAEVDA